MYRFWSFLFISTKVSINNFHVTSLWGHVRHNGKKRKDKIGFDHNKVVQEPRVSPEHTSKYVDTVTVFAKTWTKGHWPLDDLWPHICWGLMCDSIQGSLCPSPMKIHQSMWIQWPFLQKNLKQRLLTLHDLWPHIFWGHMCDSTQGSLCSSPMGMHQCMWIEWSILQITNQRSLTPRWPLTPHLLRSYVWLYPTIIVSKSQSLGRVTHVTSKDVGSKVM